MLTEHISDSEKEQLPVRNVLHNRAQDAQPSEPSGAGEDRKKTDKYRMASRPYVLHASDFYNIHVGKH